jgi:hypothetical protein
VAGRIALLSLSAEWDVYFRQSKGLWSGFCFLGRDEMVRLADFSSR